MLPFVVDFWGLVPSWADWGGVNLIIHIEFVLAINIITEVFRQTFDVCNFHFKVKRFIKQITWLRIFFKRIFIQLLVTIFFTRDNIHIKLPIDLPICRHDRNLTWVIHQISQTLKHVKSLPQKKRFLLLIEWVLFGQQFLKVFLFIKLESIPHHHEFFLAR